jgi:tetratricopeptide (TPR) repeat protein
MQKHLNEIRELVKKRESKKAESAIAKWLRLEIMPEERALLLLLRGRARLLAGRPGEAVLDCQSAAELHSVLNTEAEALELLADCYLARFETAAVGFAQKTDVREAQRIYQRIIALAPDYRNMGWLQYQLGRISLIEGQSYIAESYFHKALFSPSTVPALTAYCYERLGFIAYYDSRQPKQAIIYLSKALDTYPVTEPRLWLVQSYLLRSRVLRDDNLDAAIESAQKALQLTEKINKAFSADALLVLAELLVMTRQRETEVIVCLQRFLQLSKSPLGVDVTRSRVYEMLGDAYFATAQYAESVNAYQKALQYNPDHPWEETIHYRIAKAHYQQQQYAESVESLKDIVQDCQDYRVFNVLANAFYGLRLFAPAAHAYQTAIHLAPPEADIETMRTYYELSLQMNSPL